MSRWRSLLGWALAGALLAGVAGLSLATAMSPAAEPAAAVASFGERIHHADQEPGWWLSHGRTYDEQRFSPLTQVDRESVGRLGLAWTYDTGMDRGHEATPLVADGVMYLTTPWSVVHAVDARTGQGRWVYDPQVPRQWGAKACCDVVNRGVALWDGHLFLGTLDGRLVKLDARTGAVAWDVGTVDRSKPYTITGAPRVVKGKVIVGNGGAEYGVRGYVSAYDAVSGELAWRFFTVPGDPSGGYEHPELEAAAKTWTGEWWKAGGGGTVWDSMAFDPELDLLYVGTGNGSPWARRYRSPGGGDNLYVCSILALDPDDGRLAWHYQTTPADNWDYTSVQHIVLADLRIDGRERRVLMQAPKNGFFYVLDRATGELISAAKISKATWASHVDVATGRPVESAEGDYDEKGKIVFPGPGGAHNWQPMSYSPQTGLVYIPAREQGSVYAIDQDWEFDQRVVWNLGITWARPDLAPLFASMPEPKGWLEAWDPVRQRSVWSVPHPAVTSGGLLSTAGGLVFQGLPNGHFVAYSASDGEVLWQVATGVGIAAPPMTYAIDGVQHVAVVGGWGGGGAGGDVRQAVSVENRILGRVFAFKLGGGLAMPAVPPRYGRVAALPEAFGSPQEIQHGLALYLRHCTRCHGYLLDPDFLNADLRYSSRAIHDNWEAIVRGGRLLDAGMPAFGDILNEQDARDLHAFVISVSRRRPEP